MSHQYVFADGRDGENSTGYKTCEIQTETFKALVSNVHVGPDSEFPLKCEAFAVETNIGHSDVPFATNSEVPKNEKTFPNETAYAVQPFVTNYLHEPNDALQQKNQIFLHDTKRQFDVIPCPTNVLNGTNSELPQRLEVLLTETNGRPLVPNFPFSTNPASNNIDLSFSQTSGPNDVNQCIVDLSMSRMSVPNDADPCLTDFSSSQTAGLNNVKPSFAELSNLRTSEPNDVEPSVTRLHISPHLMNFVDTPATDIYISPAYEPYVTEMSLSQTSEQLDLKPCVTDFPISQFEPNYAEPCVAQLHFSPTSDTMDVNLCSTNFSFSPVSDENDVKPGVTDLPIPSTSEPNHIESFLTSPNSEIPIIQIQRHDEHPCKRNTEPIDLKPDISDLLLMSDCKSATGPETMYSLVPIHSVMNTAPNDACSVTSSDMNILACEESEDKSNAKGMKEKALQSHTIKRPCTSGSQPLHHSCIDSIVSTNEELEIDIAGDPSHNWNQMEDLAAKSQFLCDICGIHFEQMCYFILHMESHMQEDRYISNIEEFCSTHEDLENNITCNPSSSSWKQIVELSGENQLQCNICGICFEGKCHFRLHMESHRRQNGYVSNFGSVCLTDKDLEKDIADNSLNRCKQIRKFAQASQYKCDDCGRCFKRPGYLRIHVKAHKRRKEHISNIHRLVARNEDFKNDIAEKPLDHRKQLQYFAGKSSMKCDYCGKCFKQKGILKFHMKAHDGQNGHVSDNDSFVSSHGMLGLSHLHHTAGHSGNSQVKCLDCGTSFKCKYHLDLHVKKKKQHNGKCHFTCDDCGRCFKHEGFLKMHAKSHIRQCQNISNIDNFASAHEDFEDPGHNMSRNPFSNSNQKARLSGRGRFKCEYCGRCFKREGYLKIHVKAHKRQTGRISNIARFNSKVEDLDYDIASKLSNSWRPLIRPTGKGQFKCDDCGRHFKRKCHLINHLKTHIQQNEHISSMDSLVSRNRSLGFEIGSKPLSHCSQITGHTGKSHFECDECGRDFKCQYHLDLHVKKSKQHHQTTSNINNFISKSEDQGNNIASKPLNHWKQMTELTGKTQIMCDYCGRCFKQERHLRIHMAAHKRRRSHKMIADLDNDIVSKPSNSLRPFIGRSVKSPFTCDDCGRCFKRERNLRIHVAAHKRQRFYKIMADLDNDIASQPSNSLRPLAGPTEKSPFKCDDCGRFFKRKFHLRMHMKTHKLLGEDISTIDSFGSAHESLVHETERKSLSDRKHMTRLISRGQFRCDYCGRRFRRKYYLSLHMKSHRGHSQHISNIERSVCKREDFGDDIVEKLGFWKHLPQFDKERMFKCNDCGRCFRQKYHLHLHVRTYKHQNGQISSMDRFDSRPKSLGLGIGSNPLSHWSPMTGHTGKSHFTCHVCGRDFKCQYHLDLHVKRSKQHNQSISNVNKFPSKSEELAHNIASKPLSYWKQITELAGKTQFKCDYCGRCFKRVRNLRIHLAAHKRRRSRKKRENLDCNIASKPLNSLRPLARHPVKSPFKCDDCGRRFTRKFQLGIHMKTHKRQDEKISTDSFVSPHESLGHGTEVKALGHRRQMARLTGGGQFRCDYCGRKFGRKCYLSLHMKSHKGHSQQVSNFEKLFCKREYFEHSIAGKSLNCWEHLPQLAEERFKCNDCGRCFKRKCHLSLHVKTHKHQNGHISNIDTFVSRSKSLELDIASNSLSHWSRKTELTGKSPFECNECERDFKCQYHLDLHMKRSKQHNQMNSNIIEFISKSEGQGNNIASKPLSYWKQMTDLTGKTQIRCDYCGRCFKRERNLRIHLAAHKRQRSRKMMADLDNDIASKPLSHWRHLTDLTGKTQIKCDHCGRCFKRERNLRIHLAAHKRQRSCKKRENLDCNIASKPLNSLRPLARHPVKSPFKCDDCGTRFTRKFQLGIHLKTHKRQDKKISTIDSFVSALESLEHETEVKALSHRRQMARLTGGGQFRCDYCGRKFGRKCYLSLHMKSHKGHSQHVSNVEKLFCKREYFEHNIAGKSLNCWEHLPQLAEERRFKCNDCGRCFKRKCHLSLHVKTHKHQNGHISNIDTFVSRSKSLELDIASNPLSHWSRKTELTGKSPFECNECERDFKCQYHLDLHMKRSKQHNQMNSNITEFISKSEGQGNNIASKPLSYWKQMTDLTGKTQIRCDYCGRCFKRERNLRIHLAAHKRHWSRKMMADLNNDIASKPLSHWGQMTDLTGKTQIKCDHCGRCFKRERNLRIHLAAHKRQRSCKKRENLDCNIARKPLNSLRRLTRLPVKSPFKCDDCGRRFTRKFHLGIHMKTHKRQDEKISTIDGFVSALESLEHETEVKALSHRRQMARLTGGGQFRCDYCGRKFGRKCYLSLHMKSHKGHSQHISNVETLKREYFEDNTAEKSLNCWEHLPQLAEERMFKCNDCGRCFKRKCHLSLHVKTHKHQNGLISNIDTGTSIVSRSKSLELDIASNPLSHWKQMTELTGKTRIKCDYCGRCFKREGYLRIHLAAHKRQRSLKMKADLDNDIVSKQSNCLRPFIGRSVKSPFKCDDCGRCFKQERHLRIHVAVHKRQRFYKIMADSDNDIASKPANSLRPFTGRPVKSPFKCDDCGRCFKQERHLRIHLAAHKRRRFIK